MEKFSAYRDAGTGIQPFLTPVPPQTTDQLATLLLPLGYIVGILRTALVVLLGVVYLLLINVLLIPFMVIPPLHRTLSYIFTAVSTRLVLLVLGFWWIPVEVIQKKRGRGAQIKESWNPRTGDLIVSNCASWIELLWLAFRFNPTFVLPIPDEIEPATRLTSPTSAPGRKTGTGSANISTPSARPRTNILGFRTATLWEMIRTIGGTPSDNGVEPRSLEEIRQSAKGPVVVFPECTTSNGRALLRFAEVFGEKVVVPVRKYGVFVMCVRYDPPEPLASTLTTSIPSQTLNPLSHLFKTASSLVPSRNISIRLVAPSESPSSGAFLVSDYVSGNNGRDELSESCAGLIAQVGKMKRTGLGWEDKAAFLEFYRTRR